MNKMPPPPSSQQQTTTACNLSEGGMDCSDTEECIVNDFGIIVNPNQTLSTLCDLKNFVLVKQGKFKKRGKVNKGFKTRWFQLFGNKKLCYFGLNEAENGSDGILKGYVNLHEIESLHAVKL